MIVKWVDSQILMIHQLLIKPIQLDKILPLRMNKRLKITHKKLLSFYFVINKLEFNKIHFKTKILIPLISKYLTINPINIIKSIIKLKKLRIITFLNSINFQKKI